MSRSVELYDYQVLDRDHSNGRLVVDQDGERRVVRARDVRWLATEPEAVNSVPETDLAQQASQRPLGFAVAQHAVRHCIEVNEF